MRDPNTYAATPLDRAAHLRSDARRLEAWLENGEARIVAVWRARNLVTALDRPSAVFLSAAESRGLIEAAEFHTFLGLVDDVPHFAVDISAVEEPASVLPAEGVFEDLRNIGPALDHGHGGILAYARALFSWHRRHLFCGTCGSPTESADGGHLRRCTNAACAATHFPRLDPAVIVLIHDGGDRCVLGRNPRLPPGMHSTLAGFVEPGESLEDTVSREMREESGLAVTDIRYHSSQPWPFPSSLMLGFYARAITFEIDSEDDELEVVRWYTRDELRHSPEDETFRMPRRDSIARRLIEEWIEG